MASCSLAQLAGVESDMQSMIATMLASQSSTSDIVKQSQCDDISKVLSLSVMQDVGHAHDLTLLPGVVSTMWQKSVVPHSVLCILVSLT